MVPEHCFDLTFRNPFMLHELEKKNRYADNCIKINHDVIKEYGVIIKEYNEKVLLLYCVLELDGAV